MAVVEHASLLSTIVASMSVLINVDIIFTHQQILRHIIGGEKFTLLTLSESLRTSLNFYELLQTNLNLSGPLRTSQNLFEPNFSVLNTFSIIFGKK